MFKKSVLKTEKNTKKVMLSDRRFNLKSAQEFIYFANSRGIIRENTNKMTKYIFEYKEYVIIGEYYKKIKKGKFEKDNYIFSKFKSLETMNRRAIDTFKPILAMSYKKNENKYEGWIFYHYRDTEICKENQYCDILNIVNNIHSKGYFIKNLDAKKFNFDGKKVYAGNIVLSKNYFGKIGAIYNYIQLKNSSFVFEKLYDFKSNIIYILIDFILKMLNISKDVPEISKNYFQDSREELNKISSKLKR